MEIQNSPQMKNREERGFLANEVVKKKKFLIFFLISNFANHTKL